MAVAESYRQFQHALFLLLFLIYLENKKIKIVKTSYFTTSPRTISRCNSSAVLANTCTTL